MIHRIGGGAGGLSIGVSTVGGRIDSITSPSGRQWLVSGGGAEPIADAAIAFPDGTRGGWDECLPSIDPLPDPNSSGSRVIADHGDFWFRPWRVEAASANEIVLDSAPIPHRLSMRKTLRAVLGQTTLEIDYKICNVGESEYSFLYSAHPLWNLAGAAVLTFPNGGRVRSLFGFETTEGSWPQLGGINLSRVPEATPAATKFFVQWSGEVTLEFADGGSITVRQPASVTPWLGVCVNRASWPPSDPGPDWIALEPTSSPTDSLELAIENGTAIVLAPGESVAWTSAVGFSE